MKLDNTVAPGESITFNFDIPNTVCKKDYLVSFIMGFLSKLLFHSYALDYRCYQDLKFTILYIRRGNKNGTIL